MKRWRDVARALERKVLPQMEQITADRFLSRQSQPGNDTGDLFLPYRNQAIDLRHRSLSCDPIAAGHGMELWHLGRFDEGVPYLRFAQEGYHAQLAGLAPEERETFRKQYLERLFWTSCWHCGSIRRGIGSRPSGENSTRLRQIGLCMCNSGSRRFPKASSRVTQEKRAGQTAAVCPALNLCMASRHRTSLHA